MLLLENLINNSGAEALLLNRYFATTFTYENFDDIPEIAGGASVV